MPKLDAVNRKILELIQENGKITNAELAERTGLAPATTLDRVKKLERQGVIRQYVALLDPHKVLRGTITFVAISLAEHTASAIEDFKGAVRSFPEVLECYHLSGEDDFLLKVMVKDIATYEAFVVHKLTRIPLVGKVRSNFVLSTVKHGTRIPMNEEE